MTAVKKALNVSQNETTKHNVRDNCLVSNLMFETKYSQIKFRNVLFLMPVNAVPVRE